MGGRGKGYKSANYYKSTASQRADEANRRLNIVEASKEKIGVPTAWEVMDPVETWSDAPRTAPTINPPRPRALKIAYSKDAEKLVVRFRDGTWWEYNEIPVDMWNDLKASNSTGRYLAGSGLDEHDNMGPFDPDEMPSEIKVLFNA
jgi:KTSC domain